MGGNPECSKRGISCRGLAQSGSKRGGCIFHWESPPRDPGDPCAVGGDREGRRRGASVWRRRANSRTTWVAVTLALNGGPGGRRGPRGTRGPPGGREGRVGWKNVMERKIESGSLFESDEGRSIMATALEFRRECGRCDSQRDRIKGSETVLQTTARLVEPLRRPYPSPPPRCPPGILS